MSPKPTPENVAYLEEHGPTPIGELPNKQYSIADRQHGAAKLMLRAKTTVGCPESVAYLHRVHDPEEIIEVWVQANDEWVEEAGYDKVLGQFTALGRPWSSLVGDLIEAPERPWEPRKDERSEHDAEAVDDERSSLLDRLLAWGGVL